jgi:hypothetical protein
VPFLSRRIVGADMCVIQPISDECRPGSDRVLRVSQLSKLSGLNQGPGCSLGTIVKFDPRYHPIIHRAPCVDPHSTRCLLYCIWSSPLAVASFLWRDLPCAHNDAFYC